MYPLLVGRPYCNFYLQPPPSDLHFPITESSVLSSPKTDLWTYYTYRGLLALQAERNYYFTIETILSASMASSERSFQKRAPMNKDFPPWGIVVMKLFDVSFFYWGKALSNAILDLSIFGVKIHYCGSQSLTNSSISIYSAGVFTYIRTTLEVVGGKSLRAAVVAATASFFIW